MIRRAWLLVAGVALLGAAAGCQQGTDALRAEVNTFLDEYSAEFVRLYTASSEAEWRYGEQNRQRRAADRA